MLPKLTVIRPPMAGPRLFAACSVARRIQSASTAMATAPVANIQTGDAPTKYFRAGAIGTKTRRPIANHIERPKPEFCPSELPIDVRLERKPKKTIDGELRCIDSNSK